MGGWVYLDSALQHTKLQHSLQYTTLLDYVKKVEGRSMSGVLCALLCSICEQVG